LPSEDVEAHIESFIGIRDRGRLIAVGGLEMIEPNAVLRSIAVVPEYRGQDLATLMIKALIKQAVQSRINSFYLLTETAAPFFEKSGLKLTTRNGVPESIRSCKQLTDLCPESADCLCLKIDHIIRTDYLTAITNRNFSP
jgi:amino-acid N-acetyltransferase